MRARRFVVEKTDRMLDRLLCVVGAICAAQAPAFMQQYLQRLGGHLEEAKRQLAEFENVARQGGVTLTQFIQNAKSSSDAGMVRIGDLITRSEGRVQSLQEAQAALRDASVWERPFVFIRNLDTQVLQGTWVDFQPSIPTTAEGVIYAFLGILLALLVYSLLVHPVARVAGRRMGLAKPQEI